MIYKISKIKQKSEQSIYLIILMSVSRLDNKWSDFHKICRLSKYLGQKSYAEVKEKKQIKFLNILFAEISCSFCGY